MMVEVPGVIVYKAVSDLMNSSCQIKMRTLLLFRSTHMLVDLALLRNLIHKRADEIEKSVAGTGYLPRTVIGVGTFLLDNEGDIDLMTAKQRVIFEKFLLPLLEPRR